LANASLGKALLAQGHLAEARDSLRRALELLPESASARKDWTAYMRVSEHLLELEPRIPEVLAGRDRPASAEEALDFVSLGRLQKRHVLCALCFGEAFSARPELTEDLEVGLRYDAACFAALAAAGAGTDAAALTDAERASWRGQARAWLRADLAAWSRLLDAATPGSRALAQLYLAHWLEDPDLASLRDEAALAGLPADERPECRDLWAEAAALLARASGSG
jgi:hypothetical protein